MNCRRPMFTLALTLVLGYSCLPALSAGEKLNIVDAAVKAGSFKTLAAALGAAELVDALKGDGPFTVFAPTEEAFSKFPEGTVESLLEAQNRNKLVNILKYHVVSGRIYSDAALKAGRVKTLEGKEVAVAANEKGAFVNVANLVATDLDAANGVIHVIDSVLIPVNSQKSSRKMRGMLERAVAHGSRLYNAGHSKECAQLYSDTMHKMLSYEDHSMSPRTVRAHKMVLYRAERTQCDDSRAWLLRQGMDLAHQALMKDVHGNPVR